MATLVNKKNREVKVIIPNMREFRTFYSDNEGVIGMFFKRDWAEESTNQEDHWKPSEERPEVDLEEEVKRYFSDNFAYISSDQPTLSIVTNIAHHFTEWQKEQMLKEAKETKENIE